MPTTVGRAMTKVFLSWPADNSVADVVLVAEVWLIVVPALVVGELAVGTVSMVGLFEVLVAGMVVASVSVAFGVPVISV